MSAGSTRPPRSSSNVWKVIGTIFLILGPLVIMLSVMLTVNSVKNAKARTGKAEGTVVRIEEKSTRRNGRTSYTYCPAVSYVVNGSSYQFESSSCESEYGRVQVGDKMEVVYNPDDPSDAGLDTFTANWMGPIMAGIFGLVFTVVGIGLLYSSRKKGANTDGLPHPVANQARNPAATPVNHTPHQAGPPAPVFRPPGFPPAQPGYPGYDVAAVHMLLGRIEQAYRELAERRPLSVTPAELAPGQVAPAGPGAAAYDRIAVDEYLRSVHTDFQRATSAR